MVIDLPATRVRIPPASRHELDRVALVSDLERAVPDYKVIQVATPAGYGRTTLLAQWARGSDCRVAWYALDAQDDEPERFFRTLAHAWSVVEPGIRDTRLNAVLAGMEPDIEEARAAFIEAGSAVSGHTTFVLDDVHVLHNEDVLRSLAFLLDHLPPLLHLILSGRAMPPVPLARYLARGELMRYDAGDLRFSLEETRVFLWSVTGTELGDDVATALHDRLEGWIAGLQLASLSLKKGNVPEVPPVLSGRHRFIADYIREDVLASLPDDLSRFLLQTSLLDRLGGSVCDAVTGRRDSRAHLEAAERENLFIQPLDENREWYRYHRLFADVLRDELARREPEIVVELHRRAARWHLEHALPDQALRHAIAAGDDATGLAICDRYVNELLNTGRFRQLRGWMDAIPAAWKERYPVLGLAEAGLLLFSGALEAGMHRIEEIERRLAEPGDPDADWQLARTQAVRCFISCFMGDLDAATYWADLSLSRLRDGDVSYRVDIYHALGDSYRAHGRWDEAEAMYRKTLEVARGRLPAYYEPHVYGAMADLELQRGNLRTANGFWKTAFSGIREQDNFGLLGYPLIGWVHIRMGELAYEWNDVAAAREHLERGRESAELGGDVRWLAAADFLEARLSMAGGDLATAGAALEHAGPLLEGAAFPDWAARLESLRLELWLLTGEIDRALRRAERLADMDDGHLEPVAARLAAARVHAAAGSASSLARATRLLADVLQVAVDMGRKGVQLEALAVRAMVEQRTGQESAALLSLDEALGIGEREGYIRVFVDLGMPMAKLLQAARARHLRPEYVGRLLDAFGDLAHAGTGEALLPEPLTPREVEVLRHIAAGLTNEEIAETLYISAETVKKHASSIFGKMGVGNRTEAAARAHELGLLDGH